MKVSLTRQVLFLAVLALVLGVLNNLRPSARIEWVRDWKDFSELAPSETAPVPEEPADGEVEEALSEDEIMAGVTDKIAGNFQITDIDLKTAERFHRYAKEFTLWIDARSPELYEQGHIESALLCYINDKNNYLPEIEAQIAQRQPLALVVYCKGADCTDSHHLAEDLFTMGHENIFVYKDGFQEWYKAGLPVAGELADQPVSEQTETGETARAPLEEKPPGMYLEHVLRDLIPFALGFVFLLLWPKSRRSAAVRVIAALVVGLFFIWAAVPKVAQPFAFAKSIWNYDLLAGPLINIAALYLPMLELLAGLALVFFVFRRPGGVVTGALLVLFIGAVSINMLRGHDFNCGCTSDKVYLTQIYLEGWSDKITLLLRDFGLLVMSALACLKPQSGNLSRF